MAESAALLTFAILAKSDYQNKQVKMVCEEGGEEYMCNSTFLCSICDLNTCVRVCRM